MSNLIVRNLTIKILDFRYKNSLSILSIYRKENMRNAKPLNCEINSKKLKKFLRIKHIFSGKCLQCNVSKYLLCIGKMKKE